MDFYNIPPVDWNEATAGTMLSISYVEEAFICLFDVVGLYIQRISIDSVLSIVDKIFCGGPLGEAFFAKSLFKY
jgi:hypothetical protein